VSKAYWTGPCNNFHDSIFPSDMVHSYMM
jgi:hypothetical protein